MASHLGKTLQEVQRETTSTEFVEWLRYLDLIEPNEFHREDYYLAQIAAEVRRSRVSSPADVHIRDFLLRFRAEKRDSTSIPTSANPELSKKFWLASVGVTLGKKTKKPKAPKKRKKA